MSLLVKPKPFSGESWPGYLMRLSACNGHEGIQGIADILGVSATVAIASSAPDILVRLGIVVLDNSGASDARPGKRASLYAAGRSLRARVCPRCLGCGQEPFIKSCWDRPFTLTCPIHQILLIEACPACSSPITNLRKKVSACDCGYQFERAKGQAIDFDVSQMLSALNLQETYAIPAATFACFGKQELKAFILVRRLNELSDGTHISSRLSTARFAFLPIHEIRRALRWFGSWPENFIRMTLEAQPHTGKTIGSLIFGETHRGSEIFPAIRQALDELDRRRRTAIRPKLRCPQVAVHDQSEYVGIRFIMDATGCTYDTVKHWIHQGWLGEVTSSPWKSGQVRYNILKEPALKAIHLIRLTGSVRELAMSTGLESFSLRAMARAGVLRSISCGVGHWNVRLIPPEVFALCADLLSVATRGIGSNDHRVLIDKAIFHTSRHSPELVAPLVSALVSKKIPLRFFGTAPVHPGELTLKFSDLQAWLREMRARMLDA